MNEHVQIFEKEGMKQFVSRAFNYEFTVTISLGWVGGGCIVTILPLYYVVQIACIIFFNIFFTLSNISIL